MAEGIRHKKNTKFKGKSGADTQNSYSYCDTTCHVP